MIREYAVDPNVIVKDASTFERFCTEFRSGQGRVVGCVSRDWRKLVEQSIRKLPLQPCGKRNALDIFNAICKCAVVPRNDKNLGEDVWLDRALISHEKESFNAILTDNTQINNCQYNYGNLFDDRPRDWFLEQTISVTRNARDLADAIGLSLRLATKCMFVDSYFDPLNEDSRLPFLECVERIYEGRSKCKKVFVHTCEIHSDDITKRKIRTDIERGMNECIKPFLPEGFTVELWLWPFNLMHDRFVLTNIVGYAFGHGLAQSLGENTMDVNINRIGDISRDAEFRKFSTQANRIGEAISVTGE